MLGHLKAGDEQETKRDTESKEDKREYHKKAIKALQIEALSILGLLKQTNAKEIPQQDYNPSAVVSGQVPLNRNW